MSSSRFASLQNPQGRNGLIVKLNDFMRSPWYIVTLSVLTVICNLMACELALYTIFILIGVFLMICGRDILPLMPIVILCYVAPSPANNPGSLDNQGSIFLPENGGIYLMVLASLLLISLIFRLATDRRWGGRSFFTKKRSLLSGMLLLCGAYLLSGLGMEEYNTLSRLFLVVGCGVLVVLYLLNGLRRKIVGRGSFLPGKTELALGVGGLLLIFSVFGAVSGAFGDLPKQNLLFALIQCASVVVMYYLFSGAVDWESVPKAYFAWVGMCVGYVVLPQLLENYLSGRIFMEGTGTINREFIYVGWGMHNNIGGMMTFAMPFAFYLACTERKGWVFNLLGTILMLGIALSCSRGSILVASVIYIICIVLVLRNKEQRLANLLVYGVVFGTVISLCIIFLSQLKEIFALFIEEILIMSQRDNLLNYGIKKFVEYPIFGGSFFFPEGAEYKPWDWATSEAFSSFFPPRWHNTITQILASCGVVGIICYLWHRIQTIRLIFADRSKEKLFIGLFMAALLLCSLMDCHFFNVGPVLMYSMALAFAENIHLSKKL